MKRASIAGLAIAVAALGCGGDATGPQFKYVVEALSPASVAGVVGTVVQNGATVIVKNRAGMPVANMSVDFRFLEPVGESVSLVRSVAVLTNSEGIASAGELTLGTAAGTYLLQAAVVGASSLWFTINATADAPAALLLVDDGYLAIALPGMQVQPPRVRVADRFGNNVSGVRVTFAIRAGGGLLEGAEAVTDDRGAAPAFWMLGASPGANTVMAQALDLPGVELTVDAVEASAIYDLTMIGEEAPEQWGIESGFIALTSDGRFVSHLSEGRWFESQWGTYVIEGSRVVLRYTTGHGGAEVGVLENGMLHFDRYDDYFNRYDDYYGEFRSWRYSIRT